MNNKYIVCTKCMTYNHAPYIIDAMNGFCMQETTFPVISIIIDDASTDGEQEVIKTYLQKNFDLNNNEIVRQEETDDYDLIFAQHSTNKNCFFAVFLLKYNHYSSKKDKRPYYAEWEEATKYIAFCEGDDYWTDPMKIQRQVDALESHPELDMSACGAKAIRNGTEIRRIAPCSEEVILSTEDVIENGGGFLATNSLVLRTSLFLNSPYHFWKLMGLDYLYQILGALRGGVIFLPDCMAVYREATEESWTKSMSKNYDKYFDHIAKVHQALCILDYETGFKFTNSITKRRTDHYYSLFNIGIRGSRYNRIISKLGFKNRIALVWNIFKKMLVI